MLLDLTEEAHSASSYPLFYKSSLPVFSFQAQGRGWAGRLHISCFQLNDHAHPCLFPSHPKPNCKPPPLLQHNASMSEILSIAVFGQETDKRCFLRTSLPCGVCKSSDHCILHNPVECVPDGGYLCPIFFGVLDISIPIHVHFY